MNLPKSSVPKFISGAVLALFAAAIFAVAAESTPPPAAAKKGRKAKAKAADSSQPGGSFTANEAPAEKAPTPKRSDAVGPAVGENKATPVSRFKVPAGFKVELIYSVPGGPQGSWVNLCVDPKGRIIASDQYGGLYRFPAPAPGQPLDPAKVEKVPADIRAVNGMLWAFGALYVGVNDYEKKIPSGLYRLSDSDGDDQLDKVELLREIEARGDHGVHAVLPTPDGKGLYLVCGNGSKPTAFAASSQVPPIWGEDHLLPRMPDGRGFMREVMAPGGIIYKVTPDGKTFEVFSSGYRNIFDAALNREGELFTYDADMEYDFNTSWYRPTRVCHVTSGSEYGWRNGAGKRPPFYADNLPPVIDIGPGSPTGMTFGYGAKFPARYQNALFILDWSWGKLHAVHLEPSGSTYKATREEFLSGSPLPLTDAIIHPADGAMYFAIGGRRVQSGLYRLTYTGSESTTPVTARAASNPARTLRQQLEAFHGRKDPAAIDAAWPHLAHSDRFVRWAARTAVEHQPVATWAERALKEKNPALRVEALLALSRAAGVCGTHRTEATPPVDAKLGGRILAALAEIDWPKLDAERKLALVRTLQIALHRFEPAEEAIKSRLNAKLDPLFPASTRELNWLLCETLVYLQSPSVAAKALALIAAAPTQEEQIEYARSLRMLNTGWTTATRTAYFEWFLKAANFRGGASFAKFIEFIRDDALKTLTDAERTALAGVLEKTPEKISAIENLGYVFAGRSFTNWTIDDLAAAAQTGMKGRNFDTGRRMFGAAACFACHRFGNEGGMTGPDLTTAGGRYSARDFLDQVLNPSKEINEQFVPTVLTKNDGTTVTGAVVNLNGDFVTINEDPSDPNQRVSVDRKEVKSIEPSKVSTMPPMLLSRLSQDEILDLAAYVLSGGNREHEMFRK
jgi:putative heme-binding domain-containing protein